MVKHGKECTDPGDVPHDEDRARREFRLLSADEARERAKVRLVKWLEAHPDAQVRF
jgi:hypothetical protein